MITEEIKKLNKQGSISPSSITIQANSFRKKNKYNININMNLRESKSTRNIINNRLNIANKSKEKINLKNIQQKMNRNKYQNLNIPDYSSNTLPTSTSMPIMS